MDRIILASQSPRRRQLLEWARVEFEVSVSDAAEDFPVGLAFDEVALHIARNKAEAVQAKAADNSIIIAADTIVVLEDSIIGKPANREEAIEILSSLSGKKHLVITGVVMKRAGEEIAFADSTSVWFRSLTPGQIAFYVDTYQPYDKAGAYAIQEWIGVVGIEKIEGDFYNVMGLPVSRVINALESWQRKGAGKG